MPDRVGTLLSVNVGLPKDVAWQGRTVFTGVFKDPVTGPRRVSRLNVEGDGQGDLGGHGGEQRAVFVYQIESYRYWEQELGRDDFVYGQFGENFTVEGLGDDEVCIGDRYGIGTAVLEVTQPRVTCYRVGLRMNDPRIPALLVSHHRPGFYFRVLQEGDVEAGDEIVKLASGPERMPVAEVDALLYLPGHTRQQLLRALRIPALSPGWRASFQALLEGGPGNAGLAVTSPPPAWRGFRQLTVTAIMREGDSMISIRLDDPAGAPLPAARPGQYLSVRVDGLLRNYSLSGPPGAGHYRITVKREGAASRYLHTRLAVGDVLDVAAPRGTFLLDESERPVLLISAGIGATPVLAMLQVLAAARSERTVWWLHGARSGSDHAFAAEARQLVAALPNASSRVFYSRPDADDMQGRDYDVAGRLTAPALAALDPPHDAQAYLCGPLPFMDEISAGLTAIGIDATRVHTEPFGPAPGLTPGIAATPARAPHPPAGAPGDGHDRRGRPQRARGALDRRLRQPARARRGLRRPGALVLPDRRLPQLRDDAHRRRSRLRARAGRGPGRRQRPDLLLEAARRRRARPVAAPGSNPPITRSSSWEGLPTLPDGLPRLRSARLRVQLHRGQAPARLAGAVAAGRARAVLRARLQRAVARHPAAHRAGDRRLDPQR
jgi:ferredoxin-NADP reductase/MOSC domain-containing protein YiiM